VDNKTWYKEFEEERKIEVKAFILVIVMSLFSSCNAQDNYRLVGGPCEGCEALFEFGDRELTTNDTLPGYKMAENKLVIRGTVYKLDGKSPAPNVIMYFYQTDENGIYVKGGDEEGWAKRHGYIRGWVKTDENGKYKIYTLKPGSYPSRTEPAHIHLTILEPDGKYYYVDSYYFKDDPLVTESIIVNAEERGGNGIIELQIKDEIFYGERNIILGKNILNY
jgi:protocatechuate 3,4-dioxygenase beta subunit